jgi:hypothetical protein
LVDEARKDFPIKPEQYAEKDGWFEGDYERAIECVMNWFKKWFGGE